MFRFVFTFKDISQDINCQHRLICPLVKFARHRKELISEARVPDLFAWTVELMDNLKGFFVEKSKQSVEIDHNHKV